MPTTTIYWILFLAIAIASWLVSYSLKRKFERYRKESLPFTGCEIAERMLRENGINDVRVTCVRGHLTDHYNPVTKTVNLSDAVYHGANVAAAAVAAHECGHAVQHATAYAPLQMRSVLVPVVSFSSQWVSFILLLGMLLLGSNAGLVLLLIGMCLYAMTTLFSFITLPVEVNASKRAVVRYELRHISFRQIVDFLFMFAIGLTFGALSDLRLSVG